MKTIRPLVAFETVGSTFIKYHVLLKNEPSHFAYYLYQIKISSKLCIASDHLKRKECLTILTFELVNNSSVM